MAVARRLALGARFLDDCYAVYGGSDLPSKGNVVASYRPPTAQAAYSIMYFAKYVGCWSAIRALLDDSSDAAVYSIGAGPMFCLMGWYFNRPPRQDARVFALDYLEWEHVRGLASHKALLRDVLGQVEPTTASGLYFPREISPQCMAVESSPARAIEPLRFVDGCTVLFPMVLNHLVGDVDAVVSVQPLVEWFGELQRRAGRIIIVDIEGPKAPNLWQRLEPLTSLKRPTVLEFADFSARLSPCYGRRSISSKPESERRTGIAFPQFCRLTSCMFERGRGWRWLGRS